MIHSLRTIRLSLGAASDFAADPDAIRHGDLCDVWIRRRNSEELPGTFWASILGDYHWRDDTIRLHAILYDPGLPDRVMWEAFLRLRMLVTLMHEVGHHYWATRSWPEDSRPVSEDYAIEFEAEAVSKYVVPYLEQTYPAENDLLLSWIERHVGVRLSLTSLCADRTDGGVWAFSGVSPGSALEHLTEALADGTDPWETRLDFARNIHYGGKYDEALQILDLLLAEKPNDFQASDLRACVLLDQDRLGEGRTLVRELTWRFPTRWRAWDRLATFNTRLKDWQGVITAVTTMLDLPEIPTGYVNDALVMRARAHRELGALDAALADLDHVSGSVSSLTTERMARLRAEIAEKQAALAP